MDANGLNFWMLSTAQDWLPPAGSADLYWCPESGRLQLRSRRLGSAPVEDFTTASALVETAPMTRDLYGNYARWDAVAKQVVAGGSGAGEVVIYTPPAGQAVTDLAMGYDGALYIAVAGALVLVDRRNRWPSFTLSVADFNFWRLIALPAGGVVALDRSKPQLGYVSGLPLQVVPTDTPDPGILRSCQANPQPPRIVSRYMLPTTEAFIAFTTMDSGDLCLISWAANSASNTTAFLRIYSQSTGLSSPWTLTETKFPYAIASLGDQRFAVLATGLNEALIYDLKGSTVALVPAGDSYILSSTNAGPFLHGFDATPYYAQGAQMFPLLPLSLNSLAASGTTDPFAPKVIDSGSMQTIWHRLWMEAILPAGCGVVIYLAASDNPADFTSAPVNPPVWYPHLFGSPGASLLPPAQQQAPQAAWVSVSTEIPFAQPLLDVPPIQDQQGLFMALVQRAGTAVRNLTGRYLAVLAQLNGTGRSTPEIAALRVYGSRYSYVSHYLPELYRENKYGSDADVQGPSTRRDFFERFVNLFEAQMTRIEDGIANAYLLTRPEAAPDSALDWLGGWVGVAPAAYPPNRRRARLLATPALHRQRATAAGITHAIDVATDGLCTRGAVIVVENFRLRHIFATILGADLSDANDPLLPGYTSSSNSFVGDTLFLGNPRNPDFLALFATAMETPTQQDEVEQFLDSLAYRITIFIHNQVEHVDLSLIQRIVEHEKPAHVLATIQIAEQPFLIGLASLVGANTYLAPAAAADPAVVDLSTIGRYNRIQHVPSLDPRWENGEANAV
jgi:phage tail-like protein